MYYKSLATFVLMVAYVGIGGWLARRLREVRRRQKHEERFAAVKKRLEEAIEAAAVRAEIEWECGIGRQAKNHFVEHPLPLRYSTTIQLDLLRRAFICYYKDVATRKLLMESLAIKHEQTPHPEESVEFFRQSLDDSKERYWETLESFFSKEQLAAALPAE